MTLNERAERFAAAVNAAVAELSAPVCSEAGCPESVGLEPCLACGRPVCHTHRCQGTGVATGGTDPELLCPDCTPGPEPTEY